MIRNLAATILVFALLFGAWVLLTYPVDAQELTAGALVSALAAWLSARAIARVAEARLSAKTFLYAVPYAGVFLWELIKSNIDVALRVVQPSLPIRPGIVKVRTSLCSPIGRTILANSITLTPGTLTVEAAGEFLYVHWIDVSGDDIDTATAAIVRKFEKYLEVMFG